MDGAIPFEADEAVIKQADEVGYGAIGGLAGMFSSAKNTLILTNKNLILVKKNLFGKVTDTLRFPLSAIRVADGKVQALLGRPDNVTHSLDVYFTSGMERFSMTWEDDIKEWIACITEAVTGQKVAREDPDAWLYETAAMAESLAGSIKKVKGALGIRSDEKVSSRCPGCGASLTGADGETVQCPYCGTYYTFEA